MKKETKTRILEKLNAAKAKIEEDTNLFVLGEVKAMDDFISRRKDSKPKNPNNITMKQHMINMKAEIEKYPMKFVDKRLRDINDEIELVSAEEEEEDGS